MSTDPYGQYHSPYVAMGNVPNMSVDPDGGFNVGATLVGAATGFAVGSLIGLAVDKDNWWKYGIGGAAIGGIAGVASGNIEIGESATFLEKTRAEIKIAVTGKGGTFYSDYQNTVAKRRVNYSPGTSDVVRSFNVKWLLDVPYDEIARGVVRLKSDRRHVLEGVNRVQTNINVSDQNGNVVPGGSLSTNPYNSSNRTAFLENPEGFNLDIPKGTSQVNINFSEPFSNDIGAFGGMSHIRFRHQARLGKNLSSKQFSKKLVKAKVKRIHRKTNGGVLFGKRR